MSAYLTSVVPVIVLVLCSAASGADCVGEQSQGTGTCYVYHSELVTWAEARDACRSRGGQLAALVEFSDQDVMRYLLTGSTTPAATTAAWIGAYHTRGEWKWIETGEQLSPQGCYTDKRGVSNRDMERSVIVSDLTPERCIEACRRLTWPKTYQYAAVQGGSLCYCGNSTFGRYGTNKDCTLRCPGDQQYYCGGILMNFVYKIGGAYGLWVYAQPNNYKGNQNCGIIDTTQRAKMADESCFEPQAYMCEIDSSCFGASPDYYYYHSASGRCFYLNETKVSWETARRECGLLRNPGPGRLVTIDSASKHEAVRMVTTQALPIARKIWIGLYKGPGWQWVTGVPFNFSFWAPPSEVPGNPLSVDTCGTVNVTVSNSWTDTDCNNRLPYICQSERSGLTTTTRRTQRSTTSSTVSTTITTPTTTTGTTTTSTTTTSTTTTSTTTTSSSTTTTTSTTTRSTNNNRTTSGSGHVPLPVSTSTLAPPSSGESKSARSQLSKEELVLAILMSILGLVLLILVTYCLVMLCNKRNKVYYWYDARPIAPIPNSGHPAIEEYDRYSQYSQYSQYSCVDSTAELHKAAPW